MAWMAIGVGGAIGAMARHGVNAAVSARYGTAFPIGIVVVNVIGCLVIGLLAGALAGGRLAMSEHARTFLFVGVLGGFTTFSSYGLDTFTLIRGGQPGLGMVNALGQLVTGLIAVWAGFVIGSWRP